ncbi:MAG: hypothetical protein CMJ78_27075, partial [Planctomycetaceae bacterium]|nr:hypothetical protein [Planctomycetaceae bacterium]
MRDPGLQTLIVELAAETNGVVVVSTCARVADIEGWEGSSVVSHPLDHLSIEAGTVLLQHIGVDGDGEELGKAVEEVAGHALSVTLVGKYVVNAANGHIRDRFEIGLPRFDLVVADHDDAEAANDDEPAKGSSTPLAAAVTPDVNEMGQTIAPHAGEKRDPTRVSRTFSRIMQRYEIWLSGLQDREGDVEVSGRLALEIARLTGLFDRPITAGEFAALVGRGDGEESRAKAQRRAGRTLRLCVFARGQCDSRLDGSGEHRERGRSESGDRSSGRVRPDHESDRLADPSV